MEYEYIATDSELLDFCDSLSDAAWIAFDTEFVSEDTYRPDLCLIQVAAGERLAVIDSVKIDDVSPFWRMLAAGDHETIVHAGREEFRFCKLATNQRPGNLFDIQIAAGMIGLEYPASYGNLVSKLANQTIKKGESRTNWRRRPLSQHQMEYALQDVVYLGKLRDVLHEKISELGRIEWLKDEFELWQQNVEAAETGERWRRVSGVSGLSSLSLAIVRELWRWREARAKKRNRPPKRILRDDLIVELAKRATSDTKRISAVRGFERHELQQQMPDIARAIEKALSLPQSELPHSARREKKLPQLNLLGQFLSTALGCICRASRIAPSLVGSVQDVRDLISYRLKLEKHPEQEPPRLARGWRCEIVGHDIEEFLNGNLSIRIHDPLSDHPLIFEPSKDSNSG